MEPKNRARTRCSSTKQAPAAMHQKSTAGLDCGGCVLAVLGAAHVRILGLNIFRYELLRWQGGACSIQAGSWRWRNCAAGDGITQRFGAGELAHAAGTGGRETWRDKDALWFYFLLLDARNFHQSCNTHARRYYNDYLPGILLKDAYTKTQHGGPPKFAGRVSNAMVVEALRGFSWLACLASGLSHASRA